MSKPATKWYEIKNAAGSASAELSIQGFIGGGDATFQQFRNDFSRLAKDEALKIHICSGGGSIVHGNEIANIILGHEGRIDITLGSICGSIATVIACAGTTVTASANTMYMVHNPSTCIDGDAAEMRKTAEILDKFHQTILRAYSKKTGKSEKELSALMDAETWMLPEEAKDAGFVDKISDKDADDDVIDNCDLKHYANTAQLFEKLQIQNAGETAKSAGNGGRLTLAAIKNSAKPPTPKPATEPLNTNLPKMKTPEEIAAEKAATDKAIADGVNKKIADMKARRTEVLAVVAQEKKRTGCDFSAEAESFLDSEKPAHEFSAIILASEKKPVIAGNGETFRSGIQVVEPLDTIKGTPGFAFVNSDAGKQFLNKWKQGRHNFSMQIEIPGQFLNATQTTTSPHTLTKIEYAPGIATAPVRRLRVKELLMPGSTQAETIRFRQEDAYANAAASVAETGTLANLAVSVKELDAPVEDIGAYIEESERVLTDFMELASLINIRLPYGIERTEEDQILNGNGSSPQITGLLNTSGIQTQALGGDTRPDAIHKAMTNIRTVPNSVFANAGGGTEPDALVIHPTDWQSIRLAKDANGQYYGGGPFSGAYGNGGFSNVEALWGLRAVITSAIAQGTALVGAFYEASQYYNRQGVVIDITNSHASNFTNRVVTVRGALRGALVTRKPYFFCTVTGL